MQDLAPVGKCLAPGCRVHCSNMLGQGAVLSELPITLRGEGVDEERSGYMYAMFLISFLRNLTGLNVTLA